MMMMKMMMRSMEANKEDDQLLFPGFRFHPTDEELLSFYLRKKIENKLTTVELIKQIDIYKYDPWDLAKNSHNSQSVTDQEWYFFCKRGRKYKNSVRPNRVTGSGFWKATGIDKPIYSVQGQAGCNNFIGLKKTLVFYRGSAGKGTKTDWMMHEFRLPPDQKITTLPNAMAADHEAEVWTLCRIFKRNVSHGRYTPDWRKVPAKRNPANANPKTTCDVNSEIWGSYVSFGAPASHHKGKKPVGSQIDEGKPLLVVDQVSSMVQSSQPESCSSSILSNDVREFFAHGNWDELVSVMELPFDPSSVNNF